MIKFKKFIYIISILIISLLTSNLVYSIFRVDALSILNYSKNTAITKENIKEIYITHGEPTVSANSDTQFKVTGYEFKGDSKSNLVNLINDNYRFKRVFYEPQYYNTTFSMKFVLDNEDTIEFLISLSKSHVRVTNLTEKQQSKIYIIEDKTDFNIKQQLVDLLEISTTNERVIK